MESKSYICNMCKRKFSRKWNAFRYNIAVHSDLSKIVLNSTNFSSSPINRFKYTKMLKRISFINSNIWIQITNRKILMTMWILYYPDITTRLILKLWKLLDKCSNHTLNLKSRWITWTLKIGLEYYLTPLSHTIVW